MPLGQIIRIYDIGQNQSISQISVSASDGSIVDGSTTKVYNSNGLNRQLLNIGDNFLSM